MCGASILWSRPICSSASSDSKFDWNASRLSNSSGCKKWSSVHSSSRLFCSGVPVSSSRKRVEKPWSAAKSFDSFDFKRWPSSTTNASHATCLSTPCSASAIS